MARNKRRNSFKDAVLDAVENDCNEYGYLRLPKNGLDVFKESASVEFDIIPYEVTNPKHADRKKGMRAEVGDLWYRCAFKIHRKIGEAEETVVCLSTWGLPCPICEHINRRMLAGASKDELDEIKVSKRSLYAIVPKNHPKCEEKIHLWDISDWCFEKILKEDLRLKKQYVGFADPDDGFTLQAIFIKESLGKNGYFKARSVSFEPREYVYDDEYLDTVPKLDTLLHQYSYDELNELITNGEIETPSDEITMDDIPFGGEDEPEKKPARKPKTAVKEEPEEEELIPEHYEKPVEKPVRKKKAAAPKKFKCGDQVSWTDDSNEKWTGSVTLIEPAGTYRLIDADGDVWEGLEDSDLTLIEGPELTPQAEEALENGEDAIICKACKGTGNNSKGGECMGCKGLGIIPPVKSKSKTKTVQKTKAVAKESPTDGKCPKNHIFGTDCEKFPKDCEDCLLWEDCLDAQDKA